MIRVHIVDDHKMLVEGLVASINMSGIAQTIGVSHSLEECRMSLKRQLPDLLLLDLNLPDGNGIDFCLEVSNKYPDIKVLILTTHCEYSMAKRVLDNGASGYILKNATSDEVVASISSVMNGEVFLCKEIDALIKKHPHNTFWLTIREQQILKLIVDGYTNQEIADKLYLSIETIKSYRKNLIMKLGVKNSMMLVKVAIENNLI